MNNIKAIISDVDGVMVGKQEGINFPLPHKDVIKTLERISAQGTPIVLCTAKFGHAIKEIASQAKLHNPHITDGGALVVDWVDNKIVSQHTLDKEIVLAYVQSSMEQNIYTELYTADTYYIQYSQQNDFTDHRTKVLQTEPETVQSLANVAKNNDIIKIISFSEGSDGSRLQDNVEKFEGKVNYIWTQHPFLMPSRIMIITALGVSKQHASQEVAEYLNIPFDSILGIGDSEADWSFMKLCGYAATIGDEGGQLQELSKTKGEGHYYFASSVDEHGLLDVFKHFGLTTI